MPIKSRRNERGSLTLTCPETLQSRRAVLKQLAALGAIAAAGPWSPAMAQSRTVPTPDQILGPFYQVKKPADGGKDLTRLSGKSGAARGEVIYVMGRLL